MWNRTVLVLCLAIKLYSYVRPLAAGQSEGQCNINTMCCYLLLKQTGEGVVQCLWILKVLTL